MGFPYPGGVHIDAAAQSGNPTAFKLPHPNVTGNEFDFSFSGLKTFVINLIHNSSQKGIELNRNDLAASVQATIAELLTDKTIKAAERLGYRKIALAGGVSANTGVRNALSEACRKRKFEFYMPERPLCGDNGAMIACQGYYNFINGITADEGLNAAATLSIENI